MSISIVPTAIVRIAIVQAKKNAKKATKYLNKHVVISLSFFPFFLLFNKMKMSC